MGWKLSCIFIAEKDLKESFSSSVKLSEENILKIKSSGLLSQYEREEQTCLELAIYPAQDEFGIGAYDAGFIFCHSTMPAIFFDEKARAKMVGKIKDADARKTDLINLFPEGQILSLMLHSVVNLWAYSFYDKGKLVRSAAGASGSGIFTNIGNPLSEEQTILENKAIDSVNEEGYGEELVFEISRRLFGCRIDELEKLNQPLLLYKRRKPPFFKRLLSSKRVEEGP